MLPVDRREVLMTAAAAAAIATIAGCSRSDLRTRGDALTPLLMILFPQPGVDPSVYDDVARRTNAGLQRRDDWTTLQAEGVAALDGAAGGKWLRANRQVRISAASMIAGTSFFRAVYQTALVEFYSDPRVWAAVGYPGASAQNGGYLHNGFDDIDWLPGTAP
jgi:hypothetical protein